MCAARRGLSYMAAAPKDCWRQLLAEMLRNCSVKHDKLGCAVAAAGQRMETAGLFCAGRSTETAVLGGCAVRQPT